jgi:hypothetical protein
MTEQSTDGAEFLAQLAPSPDGRPKLVSRGVYSLYVTPQGGLHLAFRNEGEEEDRHMPIPAAVVTLATQAQNGKGPMAMLRHLIPGG